MLQEESDLLEKNNMRSAHNREVNGEGETHDVSNSGKTGKKKKRRTYKINIDEIKFRFLSELIYLFYFELK